MISKVIGGILSCICLLCITGCADSPVQHRESSLPANSSEQRAQAYARDARVMNPKLRRADAASQAAAATAGQDVRAEAEWRQSQKAAADQEKFFKDLDSVVGGK